ncbi:hypothetical protein ABC795_05545 [Blastococcus sp. HT6-30]|uniref:hypothetical protein n=1 Tax=Blastococcus sp. HT6-30 TaxID=3144843 RepID=UPI0032190769
MILDYLVKDASWRLAMPVEPQLLGILEELDRGELASIAECVRYGVGRTRQVI